MPLSEFDKEIEKLSAPEVKQQRLRREVAERKRRAGGRPPDLDPTPLAEREPISDHGFRVYREVDVEAGIRRNLEETHHAWVRVGAESPPAALPVDGCTAVPGGATYVYATTGSGSVLGSLTELAPSLELPRLSFSCDVVDRAARRPASTASRRVPYVSAAPLGPSTVTTQSCST